MTQKEFEDRTKLKVFTNEFEAIHDIYMACGDKMDKDEFCILWRGKKFRELLDRVVYEKGITEKAYEMAMNKIKKMQDQALTQNVEYAEFLLGKAEVYKDTDFYREAVKLIGEKEVIVAKLRMGLPMWEEDIEYINNNLK